MSKQVLQNIFLAFFICLFFGSVFALQDSSNSGNKELSALIQKINSKLSEGKLSKKDFAEEILEFETLFVKYKKSDDAAEILLWKGKLFQEVLGDEETAHETFFQLKNEYPSSDFAAEADALLISLKLRVGADFPDFQVIDIEGKALSLAQFKNKVVLIDFWATWCPPCVDEMPNIVKTYKMYHDKGFEIIGISLDQNKNRFLKFLEENNMTWRQYYDGKGGNNELARKYSIDSIPSTFLLNANGKIIAKNLRGSSLEEAIKEAVANL
ncbi:MAG: TlpA family protein disulfide reductase [Candidatus Aminicenantes bacterium]|nr:TlpA family protein disulfide reductase [Candidatus Aminicenantes bacterium]